MASRFGRMACQLEFLPLFFCYDYASCALVERQIHIETLARAAFFPGDGLVLCALHAMGAEPADSSQTAEELRSAPVIAHNMAVRVREQVI